MKYDFLEKVTLSLIDKNTLHLAHHTVAASSRHFRGGVLGLFDRQGWNSLASVDSDVVVKLLKSRAAV